ncbi:hypothetical protein L6V77_15145 [Myxococcota bacterium]|nr:hypothetical protein [Myxococcota bacterium]
MRGFLDSARWAGLVAGLFQGGCGYRLVQPDAPGPIPVMRLGDIQDRTTEGDLGLCAVRGLRDGLSTAGGVALRGDDDGTTPRLEGALELGPERTAGFADWGAAFEVELRGRFTLERADAPWPVWRSGDVVARVLYARGPTATAHEANRRVALEMACTALATRLLERLADRPPVPVESPE